MHLANYKPILMRRVFAEFLRPEDILCYFDPDITVKCRWSFFEDWVRYGLALVEDCTFPYLPSDHPLRYQWMEVAGSAGLTQKRAPSRHYNSGFVGLPASLQHVLPTWESLTEAAQAFGYDSTRFTSADSTSPWQAADQELLNVTVMTTDVPPVHPGPRWMDFNGGGYAMSHAVNSPKPWARDYVKSSLDGKPPACPARGSETTQSARSGCFRNRSSASAGLRSRRRSPLAESGVVLKPADAAADLRTPSGPVFA